MEFQNPNQNIENPNNGDHPIATSFEDIDSTCSTPYVSAPSSPGRVATNNGYFFSAPASPMHYILSSTSSDFVSASSVTTTTTTTSASSKSFEFEFSARFSSNNLCANGVSMSSADELFFNGQIRPMKLSSHLQRPQMLAPLIDLDEEDEERNELAQDSMIRGRDLRLRNRSLHRRARSMSPLRLTSASAFQWNEEEKDENITSVGANDIEAEVERMKTVSSTETTPSVSASSSRSSSSGSRHSKRWVFLKDFLRSKSEGRGNSKEKFWSSISFNPSAKDKKPITSFNPSLSFHESQKQNQSPKLATKKTSSVKPANGVSKRRVPQSPHELHYTTNRAQAEEMKKRTSLPYRQGLFGCLGFSSKSYGAMNGFAKALNPVSSR